MFSNTCTPTSATMFPQADRLDKVATTVDAVGSGACTASAVAVALDVVDRQGESVRLSGRLFQPH